MAYEILLGTNPYSSDSDNDGMPDWWEVITGLAPVDAADADLDTDNDGFSNQSEYYASSDYQDALSVPAGTAVPFEGSKIEPFKWFNIERASK